MYFYRFTNCFLLELIAIRWIIEYNIASPTPLVERGQGWYALRMIWSIPQKPSFERQLYVKHCLRRDCQRLPFHRNTTPRVALWMWDLAVRGFFTTNQHYNTNFLLESPQSRMSLLCTRQLCYVRRYYKEYFIEVS